MTVTRMLRAPEVAELVRKSVSGIRADVAAGKFPRPTKLGKRAIAWPLETVQAWMEERVRASEAEDVCIK